MRISFLLVFVLSPLSGAPAWNDPVHMVQKLRLNGDYTGAEKVLNAALQNPPADSPNRAILLMQLGDVLREQGRVVEARPLFERALQSEGAPWQAHFGALAGLADLDREARDWNDSIDEWNRSRNLAESHNAPALAAVAMRGLGETWMDRGNTARAEPLLRKAVAALENNSAAPRFRLASALDTLASLYREENKVAMAEDLWMRELQIDRKVMGTDHPQTAIAMGHLAEAWSLDGDFDRARDYSRQVIEIMNTHFDHVSAPVASALVNDGMVEQHARNYAGAAKRYSAALAILQSSSSEPGVERVVMQLYKAAAARAPHSGSPGKTNGFMKNK